MAEVRGTGGVVDKGDIFKGGIDMDPKEALSRGLARKSGEDRFEDMGESFQAKLRDGFHNLAAEHSDRCHLTDGNGDADEIAVKIARIADETA